MGGVSNEKETTSTAKFTPNQASTYFTVTIVFCAMEVPLKKMRVKMATNSVLVTTPRAADRAYINWSVRICFDLAFRSQAFEMLHVR